ncbi:MAG: TolC family protein [Nitrospirota bacterium]
MAGLSRFILIAIALFIASPAFAADGGKANKPPVFTSLSSNVTAPFVNASSSAAGSPSLIKLPLAPHAVLPANTPPASGKAMTLEDCIAVALGEHPRIKGAEQDVTFGRFRTMNSASNFFPQLSFALNRDGVTQFIPFGGFKNTTYSYDSTFWGFTGSWDIYDFGRTYYSVKSDRELENALRKTLSSVQENVVYDVRDAYFNLLRAQTLVKVAEDTLKQAGEHLREAQGFYDTGVKPLYDVTKAEVEVDNAKVQVMQAYDAVTQARITLNTRMTTNPTAPTVIVDRPELEPLDKTLDQYLALAVENRPDIQALQSQQKADTLAAKGALAGFLPVISASGAYDWNNFDSPGVIDTSSYQVGITVPLFQGFQTVAQVGQARAAALSAKYRVEDSKLNVLNDVASAYLAVQDAKARTEALKVSVRKAKENLDIAQGRYEAGVGNIIDVTDAQVLLTQAKTNQAQAYYDYHLAYSRLLRSTGAGVK